MISSCYIDQWFVHFRVSQTSEIPDPGKLQMKSVSESNDLSNLAIPRHFFAISESQNIAQWKRLKPVEKTSC